MSEVNKVNVFIIWAASYTGATWINLVLGSHPKVFSLGNLLKAQKKISESPASACHIHKQRCKFWPAFTNQWDGEENLLLNISSYTNKNSIVINNPRTKDVWEVINNPDIKHIQIAVKRDLRALAASYKRKNPKSSIFDTIEDWLLLAASTMHKDVNRKDVTIIEHGLAAKKQRHLIEQLRKATGLDYTIDNLRFWEHEYHLVSGNANTVGTIKSYQGMNEQHRQEFYEDFISSVREGEDVSFRDDRWRNELDRFDLYLIDQCVGDLNSDMGYERDHFSNEEIRDFDKIIKKRLAQGEHPKISGRLGLSIKYGLLDRIKKLINQLR